jgi:hypothetical protein
MRVSGIILVLCLVIAGGCETVKMAVPPDLAEASEELPISGRSRFAGLPGVDTSFRFGSYEITDVDRDSDVAMSGSVPGFTHGHVEGGYSYLSRGGRDERRGECVVTGDKMGVLFVERSWGTLACTCQGSESESSLALPLGDGWQPMSGGENRGELQAGGRVFAVEVIAATWSNGWAYEDGTWKRGFAMPSNEPTGYRVDGEGPAGGLELLHPGRVWLKPSLESTEREDMACLLGGLLLFEPPG